MSDAPRHIALLHTADVHIATFEGIFHAMGEAVVLTHDVAPELLETARRDGLDAVREATHDRLAQLAAADAVLCTCSTLGPLVDEAPGRNLLRIDRPLMEEAAALGGHALIVICLDSTAAPTNALLKDTAAASGAEITSEMLICRAAWAHFEAGHQSAFARAIADAVTARLAAGPAVDCVVLGQASMRVALPMLRDRTGVPVLASPDLAAVRALAMARED